MLGLSSGQTIVASSSGDRATATNRFDDTIERLTTKNLNVNDVHDPTTIDDNHDDDDETRCELCDETSRRPITLHMQRAHRGCGGPCFGHG